MDIVRYDNVWARLPDDRLMLGTLYDLGEGVQTFKPNEDFWSYTQFTPLLRVRSIKYK